MIGGYKPTNNIKWFRVQDNCSNGDKPLAQIAGNTDGDSEWFCLKQLWVSDYIGQNNEWRDVEVVL